MAKQTRVVYFCDLPHPDGFGADDNAVTIRIETPTGAYTVDVCARHRRELVDPLTTVGARQTRQRRTPTR